MLDRIDVHCTWVSHAVLDLLPQDLPDEIPGGEIVVDPGRGVFCDNAMDRIVYPLYPQPSPQRKREFVRVAMASLNSVGLVGMHDAGATPETLALFAEMAEEESVAGAGGGWTLRVYAMLECAVRNTFCPDAFPKMTRGDGFLTVRSVKLFAGPSSPSSPLAAVPAIR